MSYSGALSFCALVRSVAVLVAMSVIPTGWSGRQAWGQSVSVSEQYLLAAANQDRAAHELRPVRIDPLLCAAALFHAHAMAARGTISHQFSGEADLATRAAAAGARFSLVTENVAEASNSALIHDLWMKSAGHRANLLDPQVDAVGIAVVAQHGQLYAVEDFARTVERLSLPEQEEEVGRLIEATGAKTVDDPTDARQTCQLASGYAGARQPWFVMRYSAADLSTLPEQLSNKLSTGKYHWAAVGACLGLRQTPFSSYSVAVMLYP
jgi:hypothetical protein